MAVAGAKLALHSPPFPTRPLLSLPRAAPRNRANTARSRNTDYWYIFEEADSQLTALGQAHGGAPKKL